MANLNHDRLGRFARGKSKTASGLAKSAEKQWSKSFVHNDNMKAAQKQATSLKKSGDVSGASKARAVAKGERKKIDISAGRSYDLQRLANKAKSLTPGKPSAGMAKPKAAAGTKYPIGLDTRKKKADTSGSSTNQPIGLGSRFKKKMAEFKPIGAGSRFSKDNLPPAAKKAKSKAVGVKTRFNALTNPPPKKDPQKTAALKLAIAKIRANPKSKTKI